MTNREKLEIFALGLLSYHSLGVDVLSKKDVINLKEDILEELILTGINYFTNSNIGNLIELDKIFDTFTRIVKADKSNYLGVSASYDITVDSYVNAVIKASKEEIQKFETIVNNFKKVIWKWKLTK